MYVLSSCSGMIQTPHEFYFNLTCSKIVLMDTHRVKQQLG